MADLLPFWANALLVAALLGIVLAAMLSRKKCKKCGTVLREISASDPLTWAGISVTGVPRFRTVRYHCDRCNYDSIQKVLTAGRP